MISSLIGAQYNGCKITKVVEHVCERQRWYTLFLEDEHGDTDDVVLSEEELKNIMAMAIYAR